MRMRDGAEVRRSHGRLAIGQWDDEDWYDGKSMMQCRCRRHNDSPGLLFRNRDHDGFDAPPESVMGRRRQVGWDGMWLLMRS